MSDEIQILKQMKAELEQRIAAIASAITIMKSYQSGRNGWIALDYCEKT